MLLLSICQTLLKTGFITAFLTFGKTLLLTFVVTLGLCLFTHLLLLTFEQQLLLINPGIKFGDLGQRLRFRLVEAA